MQLYSTQDDVTEIEDSESRENSEHTTARNSFTGFGEATSFDVIFSLLEIAVQTMMVFSVSQTVGSSGRWVILEREKPGFFYTMLSLFGFISKICLQMGRNLRDKHTTFLIANPSSFSVSDISLKQICVFGFLLGCGQENVSYNQTLQDHELARSCNSWYIIREVVILCLATGSLASAGFIGYQGWEKEFQEANRIEVTTFLIFSGFFVLFRLHNSFFSAPHSLFREVLEITT